MIKRILSVLLIAMLLALPAAQAEQNIHTPGQVSLAWFSDAFERGDIILMDMNFQLAMNENCTALFGEDAKFLGALSKVLPQTTLTLGAARLSDGIRLLFGGQYAANEQTAALDLLVDLTRDGLTVVSSSIPGERLTASWETLLLLYGVSAEQTAQILSLRDADLEAMMAELAAQLAPTLQIAAQIAVPYGEIILQHLGELPREILTDVPAKGVYPAAATEVCILITPKSLGDLFTALANQLENDTTLCAILDAYLAQSGESITTTQLCQAVKASAAESMTDESTPLHVYIGMDEAENFLYTMINSFEEGVPVISLISAPMEDTDLSLLSFDCLVLTGEGKPADGFSFSAFYPQTPTENSILDLQLQLEAYADEAVVFSVDSVLAEEHAATEDGLPARFGSYVLNLAINDGDTPVSMALSAGSKQSATAEGGEDSAFSSVLKVSAGEVTIPVTCKVNTMTAPSESGPLATVCSVVAAPMLGVDQYTEDYLFYTAAYELNLDALTETALGSASQEELSALGERAAASLQETINTLMTLLPPEVIELMQ